MINSTDNLDDETLKKIGRGMVSDPSLFIEKTMNKIPYFYQEELLRSKERFIAACWARQLGKSWIVRMRAIYHAFTHANQLILIISATERQALHFYGLMLREIQQSSLLSNEIKQYTKSMAILKNGSQMICLAPSEKSVRGYAADVVIIDEADFVERAVIVAVEQCIVARQGEIILISTPSPQGVGSLFYQYFKDGMQAQERGMEFTEEHKFKYKVFHNTYKVGLEVTRVEGGRRITQLDPHMVGIKLKTMASWEWTREYLADWADSVGTYYDRLHVEQCKSKEYVMIENIIMRGMKEYIGEFNVRPDCVYFAGMDFAKNIDRTVLCIGRTNPDGSYKIVYFLEASGIDYPTQGHHIIRALGRYKVFKAWADKTGVGEPFIDYLHRLTGNNPHCDNLQSIDAVWLTNVKKQEIFGNTIPFVAQKLVEFPNHAQFLVEMKHLKRNITPEGNLKILAPTDMDGVNDDYPVAFALMMMCELKGTASKDIYIQHTTSYVDGLVAHTDGRDGFGPRKDKIDEEFKSYYNPMDLDTTVGFAFNRGRKSRKRSI